MHPVISSMLPILFVCMLFGALVDARYFRGTFGSAGDICIDGLVKCLRFDATCVNGACQCQNGGGSHGEFACYPPGSVHAGILNDPALRTFQHDFVHVPLTCRYLFTHFKTNYTGFPNAQCEVVVHAFNAKQFGKVYVHGFDVAISISTPFAQIGGLSIRKYGTALEGNYTFGELGTRNFFPDGPWEENGNPMNIYVPGSFIRMGHDPYNNLAQMELEACGFKLTFRPFDIAYGKDQSQVPGLSIYIEPDHGPVFLSEDKVLALDPNRDTTLQDIVNDSGLSALHAILDRILRSGTVQNQPDGSPVCQELSAILPLCDGYPFQWTQKAFQSCSFILTKELFIRCYDSSSNGHDILSLFGDCLYALCSGSVSGCHDVQAEVEQCSGRNLTEVDNFLDPDTCTCTL